MTGSIPANYVARESKTRWHLAPARQQLTVVIGSPLGFKGSARGYDARAFAPHDA